MSKYIDLELALNELLRLYEEDCDRYGVEIPECFDYGRAREALFDLPTIEVSEDAVSRNAVDKMLDEAWVDGFEYQGDLFRDLAKIPSVIPAQPNIEYILSQLVDLLDEYSELDEHGLHDPKWCGVNEAYLIVKNASQKPKEGEWIIDPDGGFKCSNCRAEEDEFIYGTGMRYVNGEPEFCPNCGAKMKGDER